MKIMEDNNFKEMRLCLFSPDIRQKHTTINPSSNDHSNSFVAMCTQLGLNSLHMWRSHAEYVWRVVYYWVQCCIVRVTCGAHSVHSAASTCVYTEREHLVYIAERVDRTACLYSVREPRGSVCVVI